jgi:aspartyl-tRNA(Asn)/glutamyl-tRNA(Gln) amidotransferase subunit A
MTIDDIRADIANRNQKAAALAADYYARIEEKNPELNCYLALSKDRALAQAERVDSAAAKGDPLGALAGVPVGIKDVLVTKGVATTAGSKILEGYLPPYDCTAVARMEAAGAVILGKLNCDEFAMGSSNENSAYGPVHNPHAHDRVPGGSSGGSAAAVAADLAVATLGTDTGGSIRQPAAFCGVVGVLPTYSRVSRYGLIAFASSLDKIGPFTRTVEDAATVLRVIAGHDPLDATSSPRPVEDFSAKLQRGVNKLRVGVPAEFFADGLADEVRQAVESSLDKLKREGAEVVPISLPHTRYAIPTYYVVATAEASANLARFDGVRYGYRAPAAEAAPPAEKQTLNAMYKQTRERAFGPEVKRRILLGTYVLSAGYYDAYYKKAQQVRALITRDYLQAFAKVDVVATPTTPTTAFKLGEKTDDPVAMYLADIYTVTGSLAGICGVSVPCGVSRQGLPIGMQILGKHFDEAMVFQAAAQVERLTARS